MPPGLYRAEVYLFQGGTVVSAQSSPLFIDKSGFERRVYDFAYQRSLAYGISAGADGDRARLDRLCSRSGKRPS